MHFVRKEQPDWLKNRSRIRGMKPKGGVINKLRIEETMARGPYNNKHLIEDITNLINSMKHII